MKRQLVITNAGAMSRHKPWCPSLGFEGIVAGLQSDTITPFQAAVELRRRCAHMLLCRLPPKVAEVLLNLAAVCDAVIAEEEEGN